MWNRNSIGPNHIWFTFEVKRCRKILSVTAILNDKYFVLREQVANLQTSWVSIYVYQCEYEHMRAYENGCFSRDTKNHTDDKEKNPYKYTAVLQCTNIVS